MKAYDSSFAVAVNAEPGSLEGARQKSHDTVIFNAGGTRRSGVHWTYWPTRGAQEALRADGTDIVLPSEVHLLCDVFPNGVLVIATVEVDPDSPPPVSHVGDTQ